MPRNCTPYQHRRLVQSYKYDEQNLLRHAEGGRLGLFDRLRVYSALSRRTANGVAPRAYPGRVVAIVKVDTGVERRRTAAAVLCTL